MTAYAAEYYQLFPGLPQCLGENHVVCDYVRRLLNYGAYTSWIQSWLVQAQYWHDPLDQEEYAAKSRFIGEINNEGERKNATYAENLRKLEKFVMVKFEDDTVVDPKVKKVFQKSIAEIITVLIF